MKRLSLLILLWSVISVSAFGQETKSAALAEETVTVYIYKSRHVKTLGRVAPAVYLDDKIIAKLDGGRYLIAHVKPGTHTLRTKNKKDGGIEMGFERGTDYYILMTTDSSTTVGNPRLTVVPKEEGGYTIKQMKPINLSDIKDRSVVVTEYPSANQ